MRNSIHASAAAICATPSSQDREGVVQMHRSYMLRVKVELSTDGLAMCGQALSD